MTTDEYDPKCVCGDLSSLHVDGSEQCAVVDCGCLEFDMSEDEV